MRDGELGQQAHHHERGWHVGGCLRSNLTHETWRFDIKAKHMLIIEGTDRTITIDMKLAAVLSLVAGAVNSAGFHALGFFSANMTGNASMLSDMLAVGELGKASGFLLIIMAFIIGAYTAAEAIQLGRANRIRAIYAYVIGVEALALMTLGGIVVAIGTVDAASLLLLGLSFLMGLQNAATTRISNSRVRTTHISGIATDIGIGLATLRNTAREEQGLSRAMMRLHLLTIAAFIAGGLMGVLLYEAAEGLLLILAGSLLLIGAMREVSRSRHV